MNQNKHTKDNEVWALSFKDIESEFKYYTELLRDKSVLLDCAHVDISNFWRYFTLKFDYLHLRRLIVPVYEDMMPSYLLELERDMNNDGIIDQSDASISILHGEDDINDDEKQRLYNSADIVIVCRSFNMLESYIGKLEELEKDWIAIGGNLAIISHPLFARFKDEKLKLGRNDKINKTFENHRNDETKNVSALWYTNMEIPHCVEPLVLVNKYDPVTYPKHDNYDAIECSKVSDIPCDYDDVIAVPPTFITKWNEEQFDIIGTLSSPKIHQYNYGAPCVNGNKTFARLLIKKKGQSE